MRMLKPGNVPLILLMSVASIMIAISFQGSVIAAELTSRSVTVSSFRPTVLTTQIFQFTFTTASSTGSLVFEYCDSPVFSLSCNAPAGLDVSAASLDAQTGNTGFSIDGANTTANKLVLTRPAAIAATVPSQYDFSNITNPTAAGQTVYIRISTHLTADGSGAYTDNGAVAYAINSPISVAANVPPFLQLCVGVTVAANCTSASGDRINLGNLSTTTTKAGTSQFAGGTNSVSGYTVFVLGTTMTSGNNTIKALSSPSPSFPGNNQFGINLRDNSIPNVGANPSGSGSAAPMPNYNTPNQFKYLSGEAVSQSTLPSNYNRMTVSYIVNINGSQKPGVYASTFTYMATATF
ncbi:MAG TPA: hypothetical protein VFW52_03150 [Candidatus Saccharimonadales bacterium]|nr:hypothetical protein [Candidatus Saccharimonadales bacterium]